MIGLNTLLISSRTDIELSMEKRYLILAYLKYKKGSCGNAAKKPL